MWETREGWSGSRVSYRAIWDMSCTAPVLGYRTWSWADLLTRAWLLHTARFPFHLDLFLSAAYLAFLSWYYLHSFLWDLHVLLGTHLFSWCWDEVRRSDHLGLVHLMACAQLSVRSLDWSPAKTDAFTTSSALGTSCMHLQRWLRLGSNAIL